MFSTTTPAAKNRRRSRRIRDASAGWACAVLVLAGLGAVPAQTGRTGGSNDQTLRRLNRIEYENTIRDLLGVQVDLKEMLPPLHAGRRPAGVKWSGRWTLPGLKHDAHVVVIATGPGVQELYWPVAKPYQPT